MMNLKEIIQIVSDELTEEEIVQCIISGIFARANTSYNKFDYKRYMGAYNAILEDEELNVE